MKTIPELCTEALEIQDACNLYALAHRFSGVLSDLRANGVYDSESLRSHPVTVLWVNKIDSLVQSDRRFFDAYTFCSDPSPCMASVSSETGEE